MKVAEAVEHMTVIFLRRIIDSFTKDFPRPSEDRAREIIVQNAGELTDPERIRRQLAVGGQPYSARVLQHSILAALLEMPDCAAKEDAIVESVRGLEQDVLQEAEDPNALQYEDASSLDIFRAVLDVAVEDNEITIDELALLRRLRRKLGIQEQSERILLAQLNSFPRAGNKTHTTSEIIDALNALQRLGVVFCCNRLDGGVYVIPEGIASGVKRAIGIELSEAPWRLLLGSLTNGHLTTILRAHGLPGYGPKEERVDRVVHAGIQPGDALGALSSSDLYEILRGLRGAAVSGTKDQRIQRVIDYFANRVIKDVPKEAPVAQKYYEYLVELAHRDRESLLANGVISKDRQMDSAFETGTRFLFEERLGLELLEMSGSDHPDGTLELKSGDLLMWDTKSKEDVYRFPQSHVRQFKRYIRDSTRRVSVFLVIVPDVQDSAGAHADLLKAQSGDDTDVAVVTADDLKWLAEEWRKRTSSSHFDPEVFNTTGLLTRGKLEQRMGLFI